MTDNTATVAYGTYENYKALKPDSKITEQEYLDYWGTGDAVNKALMEEPIRLLREFPGLQQVNMILPFEGKEYSVQSDRATAGEYFNVDLGEFHSDSSNDLWREKIVNKFFNDDERKIC